MTNLFREAIKKELHPQAQIQFKECVRQFATSLLLQSKVTAYQDSADIVMSRHVNAAREHIFSERIQSRSRELKIAIGGALLGAFLQGFINELSLPELRGLWIATYTVLGFIGLLILFWGLWR